MQRYETDQWSERLIVDGFDVEVVDGETGRRRTRMATTTTKRNETDGISHYLRHGWTT